MYTQFPYQQYTVILKTSVHYGIFKEPQMHACVCESLWSCVLKVNSYPIIIIYSPHTFWYSDYYSGKHRPQTLLQFSFSSRERVGFWELMAYGVGVSGIVSDPR